MYKQLAFIDEYGTNSFEFSKPNVSTHFIVAAVIIGNDDKDIAEKKLLEIQRTHFQGSEIKSSKIGGNDKRRIVILKELDEIPFHVFAVSVDKRRVSGEGLRYKASFYKFMNSLVDAELFSTYNELELSTDEHGSKEFMDGFIKYVNARHIPDLFNYSTFQFVKSSSSVLIQLADIVAGTLGRCFDDNNLSANRAEFLSILAPKIIAVKDWPKDTRPINYKILEEEKKYNPIIADLAVGRAVNYLDSIRRSRVPFEVDQRNCLNYLLFNFRYMDPNRFLWSTEIIHHLEECSGRKVRPYYFMSKVIAKLRDAGVIITSSNNGYKLPANEADLYEFVNHSNSIIQPLLSRVGKCRESISLLTKNEIDILGKDEFAALRNYFTK